LSEKERVLVKTGGGGRKHSQRSSKTRKKGVGKRPPSHNRYPVRGGRKQGQIFGRWDEKKKQSQKFGLKIGFFFAAYSDEKKGKDHSPENTKHRLV